VALLIKLVNVSKYYSTNNVIALGLRKANLELHVNEFVAIVGESGSGKTTLLNVICGIDSYEEGEIYINGEETSYFSTEDMENYRKKYVAFVFQNYNLIESYTVLQNVEAPMILAGYPRKEVRRRALEIIERVGLSKFIRHRATRLSGGQKQRVVIARALAKDCPIIAADEPTGNLDSESGRQILELLREISKDKLVILVTHDFDQVKHFATRKIRIYDGEIVEDIQLRSAEKKPLPLIEDSTVKIKPWEILRISLNNLLAVPKKTFFLLLAMFVATFFVAWTYGGFNRSVEENRSGNSWGFYNNSFLNLSPNRLVLRKADASAFTQADLDLLASFSGTRSLLTRDYLLDKEFIFEGYPYEQGSGPFGSLIIPEAYFGEDEPEMLDGTLPSAAGQVAIILTNPTDEAVNAWMNRPIQLVENGKADPILKEFQVTGVISAEALGMDNLRGAYGYELGVAVMVTNEVAEELSVTTYFEQMTGFSFLGTISGGDEIFIEILTSPAIAFDYSNTTRLIIDDGIADDTIHYEGYDYALQEAGCQGDYSSCIISATGTLQISDYYVDRDLTNVTIEYAFDINEIIDPTISMNSNTLEKIAYDEVYQVALIADDEAALTTIIDWDLNILHSGTYTFAKPLDQMASTNTADILDYFFSYLLSFVGLLFVVTLSLLVTSLVVRLVYNTKLKDYAIFRTIGANQSIIRAFIYTENFYNTLGSYLLFLPLAFYLRTLGDEIEIFSGFGYYNAWHYVVLFGILFLISILNSRRYCRKVFRESVSKTLKTNE
jgi:ABC-type lipoprotein export system ATPase subunit